MLIALRSGTSGTQHRLPITVAILAQGTSWAVAVTQAFFELHCLTNPFAGAARGQAHLGRFGPKT